MTLMLQKLTLFRIGAAEWVRHSLLWKCFNPLRNWRQHSFFMQWGTELSVCLLTALFAIAPFVGTATGYIGILTIGCTGLWLLLTLSDDAPQPTKISPVHGLLALYWICAGLSTALSPAKREAFSGLAELSLYLMGFALMERTVRVKRWRDWLIVVYLLAAFAVSLYGLRQCIFGEKPLATWVDPDSSLANVTRAFSYLGNPNLLASYLLPAVPLSLTATFLWKSWGTRVLGAVMFVVNTICLIMTLCRGAWIGLVVSLALMGILVLYWFLPKLPKFWRVWSIPVLLGGGTLVLAIAVVIIPPLRERVLSIFASRGDSSNNFRFNVWEAVKEMIWDRPIFGIGPGHDVFNKIYPLYQCLLHLF
jgi:putative inorganic carbon (hco3(-)) transporter